MEQNHPKPTAPLSQKPKKNWIIVGGAAVAAIIVVLAAIIGGFYFLSNKGPNSSGALLALVPEDVQLIAIWDVEELLDGYLQEAYPDLGDEGWPEDLSPLFGGRLKIDASYIERYVHTFVGAEEVEMISGALEFDDIRDDLDDNDYEESSYRGYELWTNWSAFALLEDEGILISGETENSVKDVLNNLYQDRNSLAKAVDEDIAIILNDLGPGAAVMAATVDGICPIGRCQGIGIAVNSYDIDEEEATAEYRMLFSSERAAEAAADEYDGISDLFEFSLNFHIFDAEANGEFVQGTGTGDRSFLDGIQ